MPLRGPVGVIGRCVLTGASFATSTRGRLKTVPPSKGVFKLTATIIATRPSIRFVKGVKPEIVNEGELEYQAGQLSLIGRKSIPGVVGAVRRYLKDSHGWTEETNDDTSLAAQGAANFLLSDNTLLILACDATEQLKPADLLEWDEDFFERCFRAVVELNPRFDIKPVGAPDTGQAQPETHNQDGTPKSQEETPKN